MTESNSACCSRCYSSLICLSVCLSGCLSVSHLSSVLTAFEPAQFAEALTSVVWYWSSFV